MTGQTLGHFQILEKLGSGGMGEVYKARDNRLNRLVAVKVLPPDKVANAERKRRFIQEAQSASALNHPNIVTIYDINEVHGVDYMVMEFIAGKTLDATIPRQGMRLGEALKIAIPVADGLAKAHYRWRVAGSGRHLGPGVRAPHPTSSTEGLSGRIQSRLFDFRKPWCD